MPLKKICFIFFAFCLAISGFSQEDLDNRDAFLARQFFENGAFDKAAEYYKTLIEQPNGVELYYDDYKQTLIQLKDWTTLKKLVKSVYKASGKNPIYQLELGGVYLMANEPEEAIKIFSDVLKSIKPIKFEYLKVANKFLEMQQQDWALKTYLLGKEKLAPQASFNIEIGQIYRLQNNKEGMLDLYLDELLANPTSLEQIENNLQAGLNLEEDLDNLESILLKKVAQNKNELVYQDVLVWLYMQRNDFDAAISQATYLDRTRNEQGDNLMKIAHSAAQQKDYDAAIKGFQAVVDMGQSNYNYVIATLELLSVKRDKIILSRNYTNADLLSLKGNYQKFLLEYYNPYTSSKATIDLAKLNALYIHDLDTAIAQLEELIANPRVDKNLVGTAKIDLGDYYILAEQPWESILLYTQVEKDFKGNPIGEEAKYRNAKLSYYKGDFEWAQTQLKIIKTNTTEYISNDAIDLSVFIGDNTTLDTTLEPMMLFAQADLLRFQNKLEASSEKLDFILQNYPNHSLTDDIYWLKANLELDNRNFEAATTLLKKIVDEYATDLWGDNALFLWAEIEQFNLNHPEKAKELYEKLILDFQGSTFMIETRKRYRLLRGEKIAE